LVRRAEVSKHRHQTARGAGKFFARDGNFPKNMLHNFNNFVQLPASDIGFHAFHERSIDEEIDSRRELKCELPEVAAERQLVFRGVRTAVS